MVQRTLSAAMHRLLLKYPVLYVSGPRQSGKTTLLKTLLPDYRYVNLESPDERERVREDIRSFLRESSKAGVIVDEAQRLPELFSYLQGYVDETGEMGQFVLSGSQDYLMMEGISQSLSGRVGLLNLFPFTIDELKPTEFWWDDPWQLVYRGMYPALYDRVMEPGEFFPGYVQTYLERDVRSLKNIGDLTAFQRFLQLCAGRVGQIVNYSALANDLGIDHKTAKSWMSVLQAGFVVFFLNPHHRNFNKRVIKQPKLYFYDTGLAAHLLRIRAREELDSFYLRGAMFENFVVSEYVKQAYHLGRRPDAAFFRDATGNEVDLVIDRAGTPRPVEIKAGATVTGDFFNGLKRYQALSGVTAEQSFLVYSGAESMQRKIARVLSWRDVNVLQEG